MKLFVDLLNQIIRNILVWKLCISLTVLLSIVPLLELTKDSAIYKFLFAIIFMAFAALIIYNIYLLFRIFYDLTSVGQYKGDISLSNFFWLNMKYQFIFGLFIFLPSVYILNSSVIGRMESVKNVDAMYSILRDPILVIFRNTAEFLYIIGLVVVIGSRSFDAFFDKLRILFFNKSVIKIIAIVAALSVLIELIRLLVYPEYSNSSLYSFLNLFLVIGYLIFVLLLIREWQKLYFRSEPN
ncbi:hypothetical protein V6Z05_14915 [Leptospira venezuelensis]|uniref:hypothetical protein n=1 Tax=Leptospira venezuelensis TaxID=1958811 RepID=UPI000A36169A|nr:hypothetical protein [Leptospira venezuelensis]